MQQQVVSQTRVSKEFSLASFLWRYVGALALVLLTYNPTEFSYVDWVWRAFEGGTLEPLHYFIGVLLAIGWTVLLVATGRSLGALGLVLGVAFFGTLVWLLIDFEVLHMDSVTAITWVVLVCLAGLLAIGLSWSHIRRRITGQFDVDELDG